MSTSETNDGKTPNRLIHETSPYLLQHAHNPVDWHPWGEAAFELARREGKAIFLSVGYSSCHWCHVMERESFENEAVARVMNDRFVSIKVDREERPDLDEIYMTAVQVLTQRGGWPMSVWLTPDGKPFHGGTYYPARAFIELLTRAAEIYATRREEIEERADQLTQLMADHNSGVEEPTGPLSRELCENALSRMGAAFDESYGGFGREPKFPPSAGLPLLLHEYERSRRADPIRWTTKTLDAMALGGIRDHIAGGFHRYSTDRIWLLPHFEKMLYDNAQLSRIYAEAYRITGRPLYRAVAEETYDWVLREMLDERGGFHSALDADSDGEEGKFYTWRKDEIEEILGSDGDAATEVGAISGAAEAGADAGDRAEAHADGGAEPGASGGAGTGAGGDEADSDDAALFCDVYSIDANGNFLDEATHRPTGVNIPHLSRPLEEHARDLGESPEAFGARLSALRKRLREVRDRRVWPMRDDKVLAAWNGLMIGSLARGGAILNRPDYLAAAARAADFILREMVVDGRLLRTHRAGASRLAGYLEDYAMVARGLLDLHEAGGGPRWLTAAVELIETMNRFFWDDDRGGYYNTASDHEEILLRSRAAYDQAMPSGNSTAALGLLQLARITGDPTRIERAGQTVSAFLGLMQRNPLATETMILAASLYLDQAEAAGIAIPVPEAPAAPPVRATAEISPASITPGGRSTLTVKLEIAPGWHLPSDDPGADYLSPTQVRVSAPEGLSIGLPRGPFAATLPSPSGGPPISVFEGTVEWRIPLQVEGDAPEGLLSLRIFIDFQACDDSRCLAPATLAAEAGLRILRTA